MGCSWSPVFPSLYPLWLPRHQILDHLHLPQFLLFTYGKIILILGTMQSFLEWSEYVKCCNLKQFSEKNPSGNERPIFLFYFLFSPIYASSHFVQFQLITGWIFLLMSAFQNSPCLKKEDKRPTPWPSVCSIPSPFIHPSQCFPGWEQSSSSRVRAHTEGECFLKIQAHADFMHVILFFFFFFTVQSGGSGKWERTWRKKKLVFNFSNNKRSHF